MIRTLAPAAALAALALATFVPVSTASAQTYGQPVYLNAYGRPVGGTPLSEVETRSYVETGRWADGSSDRPHVYVPAPGYGQAYGAHGFGRGPRHGYGHDRGYSRRDDGRRYGHDAPSRPGYRDDWGYGDDRPPSARRGSDDRHSWRDDPDCGCRDVYLYDR